MTRPLRLATLACLGLLMVAAPAWAADPVVVAAGDVACGADTPAGTDCVYAKTADTVASLNPDLVITLGDEQYEKGQYTNFRNYYDRTWGRFKTITRPVVGNHEYLTSGAQGYFDYFNGTGQTSGPAGDAGTGYYSYDIGQWHVVTLNSNCSIVACYAGSPQEQWLRADLAADTQPCTLAVMHHPRWSSDYFHLDTPAVGPLVSALYDSGADLLLAGHAHDYERFAPQNPSGAIDSARGITQIISGTGGRSEVAFADTPNPNSLVRKTGTYGALRLGLHNGYYDFKFVPIAGQTWTDSGAGSCHNSSSSQQRVLTYAPSGDTYVDATKATKSFGGTPELRADSSPQQVSYLKFDVAGLAGAKVTSAKLRLYNTEPSKAGGTFNAVADTSWTENSLTWNTRPASGALLGTLGQVSKDHWYEVDVTPLVKGDGSVALAVSSTNSDGVIYASTEAGAAKAPQLVVTAAPGDTTAPSVPAAPTATAASTTRVELSWPASADNVGVTGYRILRDGSPIGTSATTTFADDGVAAGSTHSYAVTAYDAAGNESAASTAVSVTTPTGQPTSTLTFTPTDDTYVQDDLATSNFGHDSTVIYDGSPHRNVFMKFNVSGVGTGKVLKTVIHLTAENESVFGGYFQRVPNTTWTEDTLNWNNQPAADPTVLAKMGRTVYNATYDVDVTGLVTGDGPVTLRISSDNADGGGYWSKDGGKPAQLQVTVG